MTVSRNTSRPWWFLPVIGLVLFAPWVYVAPVYLFHLQKGDSAFFFQNQDGFISALERSIIIAALTSVFSVCIAFLLSLIIKNIAPTSILGKLISFFALPLFLGNLTVSFVFKRLYMWSHYSSTFIGVSNLQMNSDVIWLSIFQLWQYIPFFTFLFWFGLQHISNSKQEYLNVAKATPLIKLRYLYLPHCRNLIIILIAIAFTFTFYDEVKATFIFKASQGYSSEVITQWLTKHFTSNSLISFPYALSQFALQSTIVFLFCLTTIFTLSSISFIILHKLFYQSIIKFHAHSIRTNHISMLRQSYPYLVLAVILSTVFAPIVIFLLSTNFNMHVEVSRFLLTIVLTLASSLLAITATIIVSAAARITWRNELSSFTKYSSLLLFLFLVLYLLPPFTLVCAGYKWLSIIGYTNQEGLRIVWIFAQAVLAIPLLMVFSIYTCFRVSTTELEFVAVYRTDIKYIYWFSFLRRLQLDYLFIFLYCISIIWNEAVVSKVLSNIVPSFASTFESVVIGRGADFSSASAYVMVGLLVASACIIIWCLIMTQRDTVSHA